MKIIYLSSSLTRSGEIVQMRDIEIGEILYHDSPGSKYYMKRDDKYFYSSEDGISWTNDKIINGWDVEMVSGHTSAYTLKGVIQ